MDPKATLVAAPSLPSSSTSPALPIASASMAEGPAIEQPSIILDPVAEVPEPQLTPNAVLLNDPADVKLDGVVSLPHPITRATEVLVAPVADVPAPPLQSMAPAAIGPNSEASAAAETTSAQLSSVPAAPPIKSASAADMPAAEHAIPARAIEPPAGVAEPQLPPIAVHQHSLVAASDDVSSPPPGPITRTIEPGAASVAAETLSPPQGGALMRLSGTPLSIKMAIYAVLAGLALLAFKGRPYPATEA